MRKNKALALALAAAMTASMTSITAMADETEGLTSYYTYQTAVNEMETFCVQNAQNAKELQVLTNCIDGLLSMNTKGELIPGIAKEWGSEDNGKTWTFKLRDDATWVDYQGNEMAKLTAMDFAYGLEFTLNYWKNGATNTSMPIELIEGASEYYEYTKGLDEETAMNIDIQEFLDMTGISVPDDYTFVVSCLAEKPYFDTVCTYACMYPISGALLESIGADGYLAASYDQIWYDGPYTITEYIQGNEKILTRNDSWYDTDSNTFDEVVIKMVDSLDTAFQLYQTGELDAVELTESNVKIIYEDENNEYHDQMVETRPDKYSWQMKFNYNKLDAEGNPDTNWNTAIANLAFRKSLYYGLDLESYYARTNAINPLKCENNAYTMRGLCTTSDGTDYVDLVLDKLGIGDYNGETMVRLDADKFAEYKAQAIEELTAAGVTFPIQCDYYIASGNQTQADTAQVLKQAFSASLGDDFIVLNIKEYVSSFAQEVRIPHLFSIAISGWGADYGDPQNFMVQETYGNDNAYFSANYTFANELTEETAPELVETYKTFTDMVEKADAITDNMDNRYEAYAEAEAYMIENVLSVPLYYNIHWQLTHVNDYSKIYSLYGIVSGYRYVNFETSKEPYTTEQYDDFEAAAK